MPDPTSPNPEAPRLVPPPRTYAHMVARWCILPLVRTPVTPNHLTTLRLISGLGAAVLFALGGPFWTVWGGVVFAVSAVLDRADGELARVSGRISKGGHWFDLVSDMVVNVATFLGIGIGLADRFAGPWGPILGALAGLSVGATFIVVFLVHTGGSHPSVAFSYPSRFDFDDALFLIAVAAWFNALLPLLYAAAIGAPLFLAFALWRYWRLKAPSAP
ncbi:MAG: CDP-alcohol phosphatidyltransferase family protein [Verrucomicrobiae bacterium]|nr:CDP-alcohol phosphatidyltransferase family protein [Verrucomicrobiae bacterium]